MKTNLIAILTFISFVAITACNDNDGFTSQTVDSEVVAKTFIASGNGYSNLHSVLYSQNEWDILLNSLEGLGVNTEYIIDAENQEIDFNNFQLIAVFYDGITSSGTTIDITNITENENEIVVTVENLHIGTTTDVAQPFEIVKIPKIDKPVVFE
ncbi:MAG: hypothetical protein WDA08_03300 [Weeksellaceae bacterium]